MKLYISLCVLLGLYVLTPSEAQNKANKRNCYKAKTCIHDNIEKCGMDRGVARRFLDVCDIYEFNCLKEQNFVKTTMEDCTHLQSLYPQQLNSYAKPDDSGMQYNEISNNTIATPVGLNDYSEENKQDAVNENSGNNDVTPEGDADKPGDGNAIAPQYPDGPEYEQEVDANKTHGTAPNHPDSDGNDQEDDANNTDGTAPNHPDNDGNGQEDDANSPDGSIPNHPDDDGNDQDNQNNIQDDKSGILQDIQTLQLPASYTPKDVSLYPNERH